MCLSLEEDVFVILSVFSISSCRDKRVFGRSSFFQQRHRAHSYVPAQAMPLACAGVVERG